MYSHFVRDNIKHQMVAELVHPQSHPAARKMRIEVHCFVLLLNCCCYFEPLLHVLVVGTVLEFVAFCENYLEVLAHRLHHL